MTAGPANTTGPRWSPDGKKLLFLSKRAEDEFTQVYVMNVNGGEALRVTAHGTDISAAEWTNNGTEIFFLADDSKPSEQIAREKVSDDIYKFEQDFQQKHLWKVEVGTGKETRITQGDFSIINYSLSKDGTLILHNRQPSPLLDAALESEIWLMAADGNNAKQITRNKNPEINARLSPDNSTILYMAWTDANDVPYFEDNLFLVDAKSGAVSMLLNDFDHDIEQAEWSADGKDIYFQANMGVHNELFKLDGNSRETHPLTDGNHTVIYWQYNDKTDQHLLSIRTAHNNGDFWVLKTDQEDAVKITGIFDHYAEKFDLPKQDVVRWKGEDGVDVEGMLIYPNDYKAGNLYPLVVQTHGGPRSSDQWGIFDTSSYATVLAANGYMVLRPNYRGSLGYGDDFVRDMVGSYFNQSHLDVMAGVDHLIAEGLVDEDRMVKMGYSAGGHMTNKLITFTDRFVAASSAAGTINWISMYSQSDVRVYRTPWFGGTPWQKDAPIDKYWNHSPIKDISNVTTPTMIIVGGADVRVPKEQSIELYRALKSNGVDTELYIVPRENHGWRELRHKLSKMNVEMSWFEKYVHNREFSWEKAPEN
jgi:dipeptidyl aminopeptidase/acylaminoacyl peptidase